MDKIKRILLYDIYLIPKDEINIESNYLFVATLPGTNKIINMYPINDKFEIGLCIKNDKSEKVLLKK